MSVREMIGLANQEGRVVGSLTVGPMVRRSPQPIYETVCSCGAKSTHEHVALTTGAARCKSSTHDRTNRQRDRQTMLAAELRQREAERLADEQRLAAERMAAEVQDYKLPSSRRPIVTDERPMPERDRIILREHRAELEAAERLEREQREAPIRQAEAALQATANQLAIAQRDRVAKLKDDAFVLDSSTITVGVPVNEVDAWNSAEAKKFRESCPGYFPCEENLRMLSDYIARNAGANCPLVSANQLRAAFNRLNEFKLLKERPAPEPKFVALKPKPVAPPKPTAFIGRDYATGFEREFSEREIERMSSLEYRRAFPVAETVSEFFTAVSQQRKAMS